MIRYALACPDEHRFEAWFANAAAYDEQRGAGLLECPVCGSSDVGKALMTPSVSTARKRDARRESLPVAQPAPGKPPPKELVDMLRRFRAHVVESADYVGPRFAEEARKIHYEEAEPRGIYGEATPDEAASLDEEGIEILPLPILPEDRN